MTPQIIIDFWYVDDMPQYWFASTPELDQQIQHQFETTWQSAVEGELDGWLSSAEGCLALIILLDQFPLNMFRGQAKSFASEVQAIAVTKHALQQGFDQQLNKAQLSFLLMPLMHSENLADQNLSVASFTEHQLHANLDFAKHHQGIVAEFGRFPHRNAILGRTSTEAEVAYLNSNRAFMG